MDVPRQVREAMECPRCRMHLGLRADYDLPTPLAEVRIGHPPLDSKERRHIASWTHPGNGGSKYVGDPVP